MLKKAFYFFISLTITVFFIGNLYSQEISEKKEIAIFKLSHYDYDIPESALGSIDEELKSVFINLGRFDIVGLKYRLAEDDAYDFIERIKEFKHENVEIPEEFKIGHEVFTEKDMNKLIGSFYVVIPAVTYFNVAEETTKLVSGKTKVTWDAEIKTSFSFINVAEAKTFAQFFVETSGSSDEAAERAVQDAIDDIPVYLEYEITKIPEFTLKTGVLERRGREVVIELGRDMGIKKGYEFTIVSTRILESGRKFDKEAGLLLVKEVGGEVSIATILLGSPLEGDQLKEIPRLGFEVTPYLDVIFNPFENVQLRNVFSVVGVKANASKGFYDFKPLVGIEVPLPVGPDDSLLPWLWVIGFPFTTYLGGEWNIYMGPLQITPQAAFGAGYLIPWLIETEKPAVTHVGGVIDVSVSYLFNQNMKATVNAGLKYWYGVYDALITQFGASTSYGGVFLGGGVTFKL